MLIVSGLAAMSLRRQGNFVLMLRGASTLYMTITGVVFAVLLSDLDVELTAVPWDNIVLHYIVPVAVVVDWILDPPRTRIAFRTTLVWLVYPLLYLAYSLVRGHFVGWYPYPFLDPNLGGYSTVAWVSVGIIGLSLVVVGILINAGKKQKS